MVHYLLVIDWQAVLADDDGNELQSPASESEVDQAEELLGVSLPSELRAMYLATDGVLDKPGQWFVIWPLADLVRRNQLAWATEPAARRELVGFGDDGTGNPFCVPRDGSGMVLSWDPIDMRTHWLAENLARFWVGWSSGSITT